MIYKLGTELTAKQQEQVLRAYVYRYTKDHKPAWIKRDDCAHCKPQFASDADWLANTRFAVTKSGELSKRNHDCESTPTWPDGQ